MEKLFIKLFSWFRIDVLIAMFRSNERLVMTKGLRLMAYAALAIALVYAVAAYMDFKNM